MSTSGRPDGGRWWAGRRGPDPTLTVTDCYRKWRREQGRHAAAGPLHHARKGPGREGTRGEGTAGRTEEGPFNILLFGADFFLHAGGAARTVAVSLSFLANPSSGLSALALSLGSTCQTQIATSAHRLMICDGTLS